MEWICKDVIQNVAEIVALQESWKTWEVGTMQTALPRLEMLLEHCGAEWPWHLGHDPL